MEVANRLAQVLGRIDALNSEDPNIDSGIPKELLYSQRMTERLQALEPGASEELQIAVRAQHLCRWRIPRADYPMDRSGYKRWRSTLAAMHGDLSAEVMEACGYGAASVDRVRKLLQKRGLKSDPEVQILEDCACLVFLEHYFADFAAKHEDDKVVDILAKTWKKMTARGHREALALLPALPPDLAALTRRAVGASA